MKYSLLAENINLKVVIANEGIACPWVIHRHLLQAAKNQYALSVPLIATHESDV